jgi:hypothetical protein
MSRAATGDTVVVKPSNNVFTVLALVGVIASAIGIAVLFMRAKVLAPDWSLF